jgi:hypothetical protein
MPTNDQIDKALRYVLEHSPIDIHTRRKELVQDTQDIIGTARLMDQQEDADQLLQKFLWHTRAVDSQKLKTNGLNEGIHTEGLKSDSDQGITTVHGL